MITVSQAKRVRVGQTIYIKGNYDSDGRASRCRVTGKIQFWKTRPNEFRIPVKRGLYEYGEITHRNASRFTLSEPASRKASRVLRR